MGNILIALLLPILGAVFYALPWHKWRPGSSAILRLSSLAFIIPAFVFGIVLFAWPTSGVEHSTYSDSQWQDWIPLQWQWNTDGLARLFSLLISGIGTLIFIYAHAYMKKYPYKLRLLAFLSLFMGAMLGVVLADNLLSLFLFWELTSISSFFLIGFNNTQEASRQSALKALAITGGGGLIMLAGFFMLGEMAGTYNISEMLARKGDIHAHAWFVPMLILICLGAFTKSAQFPFHFWLPGAMKAPTPVSAYLHSATMVKAGVYLLARLSPLMSGQDIWHYTLMIIGGLTMIYAAFHAILRSDMKSILAYSTVSALGVLVFLIGIGSAASLWAASLFILVHALYKASLFLVTGIVDLKTGSRDVNKLSGLRKVMWPVALAGLLAAVSNAGIPPSLGFVGKDLIYEATWEHPLAHIPLTTIALLSNALLLVAGFLAGWKPFSGSLSSSLEEIKMPDKGLWIPALLLASLGMLFGLFPSLIDKPLTAGVYSSIYPDGELPYLALWHGFNVILLLSVSTLALGFFIFWLHKPGNRISEWTLSLRAISSENIITRLSESFYYLARFWTKTLQNGYLRYYITAILVTLIGLLAWKLGVNGRFFLDVASLTEITSYEAIAVIVMLTAVVVAVLSRSRLAAVAAMGVVGYGICIIFVFYSAPDLAMTQFTIDTLTVILFVLVLYKLPRFIPLEFKWGHIRDILVSLSLGGLMTLLTLEVLQTDPSRDTSRFYVDNSYILAKGKNVVNVILVDFRGTDTMIEIVVLSIAAIGVFSLLKLRVKAGEKVE